MERARPAGAEGPDEQPAHQDEPSAGGSDSADEGGEDFHGFETPPPPPEAVAAGDEEEVHEGPDGRRVVREESGQA